MEMGTARVVSGHQVYCEPHTNNHCAYLPKGYWHLGQVNGFSWVSKYNQPRCLKWKNGSARVLPGELIG